MRALGQGAERGRRDRAADADRGLVKAPLKAMPAPLAPAVSMKYSAATTLLRRGGIADRGGDGRRRVGRMGLTFRPDVVGPNMSLTKVVETSVPQLPAASSPCT